MSVTLDLTLDDLYITNPLWPTDAAGAVCDGGTLARARAKGLDVDAFLANNDAYNFFAQLGDGLLITGPTGTNVADVAFLLVGAAE